MRLKKWLTLVEAGEILDVAPNTIRVWIKEGKLEGQKCKKKSTTERGTKVYWVVNKQNIYSYLWKYNKIQYQVINTITSNVEIESKIVTSICKYAEENKFYKITDSLGHTYTITKKKGDISIMLDNSFLTLEKKPDIIIKDNKIITDSNTYDIEEDVYLTIQKLFSIPLNLFKLYLYTGKILWEK